MPNLVEDPSIYYTYSENSLGPLLTDVGYRVPEPGESEREELLERKLGIRGWGRFHYFKKEFSGSWGEGREKPLSPKAQEALLQFLKLATFPKGVTPSIFITPEGHLELAWEDQSGKTIQVEFGPKEVEIYREATGLDTSIEKGRMVAVVEAVCA